MDNNIYKRGRLHSIIKLLFATVATMLFALSFNMTGGGQQRTLAADSTPVFWQGGTDAQHNAWLHDNVNSAWTTQEAADAIDPTATGKIDEWMPDKDLQAIVLKQLQNDKVAVTSVDQITKQMLEDHLTIIYTAVNPSSQMNSKDIFQHLLNVQSLTGLQYAKNLTSVSFHSYLGAFEQHDLPFRNGYLSDISSLGLLTKMNSVDIQRNNVHDISAVSNMQLGSGSGFSWNSITDVSPLQKSKDTIGSGISLTAMIYMLPSITLNASVSSYTMSSFIIKNIDGANVPITPYYYDTYQQSLSTAFAKKYISTAEGGASNEPVQEVKWTDLAKAGNSGYLTTYWRDTLFGLPTSPYEGVVV